MDNEKQDNKAMVQERLISFLEDETKISAISKLLDMVENNSFDSAVSNIENFYTNYGDFATKKKEIDEILDDVKKSQEQIDDVYNEIYDINDSNIELKDSSSILNNLRQASNDFATKKKEIDEILDDVKKSQEQIDDVYNEIYDINDSNIELKDSSSILNNLRQANGYASKIIETYIKFYGQEDANGIPTQGIVSKLKSACKEIEESMDKINDLKDFYKEVFEGAGDGENLKDDEKALVDFLADKRKELADTIKKTREDLKKLKDKIEELLPGATSAGLADAYKKQRKDAEKGLLVWSIAFWGSIGIFLLVFAIYFFLSFREGFSYVSVLRSLPLWVFSGFFTFYSTQQISEYKRISNEYRHKESLASSYVGFEKLIEEIGDEGLRIKLLENTVEAIKTNPSDKIKGGGQFPSFVLSEKFLNSLPLEVLKKFYDKIGNIVKNQ